MSMTPRNIAILILAIIIGLYLGFAYPLVGLICLVGGLGFAAFVVLRNNQGSKVDDATRASAMTMIPSEGRARLYFARRGFMGGAQGMNISIDGDFEGQIRSGYFMMAEVAPGTHNLSAKFNAQTEGSRVDHVVTVEAGESVLFEMSFDMGALQGKIRFDEQRDKRTAAEQIGGRKMVAWRKSPAVL
ncbi:DUF2846 domain-containing protein [Altererythrobacter xixiisoli]|uniref:DUF2846 domain-containing protein n=1 Tax=Croceibacterium xixiisoli TaxID=1476466 RepID=A0A6I4TRW0_9SPHN|nr:DUF2846 domain-containing protein [Croceibacterium xixiisoli]MXO98642.1 DUF2846 domain-containing protein [Croceibacterium xixiisoli]